ncbi:IS630 family transposase [Streptomyces sp. NPDC002285]
MDFGTWWRAYQARDREALAVPVKARTGQNEVVSAAERAALFQAMADYTPEDLLIGGPLWTRGLVGELIQMVTGVRMTERGIGKWLHRHGYTPQRPDRRSYPQDQEIDAWLKEEYPAITARARAEKAVIAWADQCSLRSDTAPPGSSWALAGQTPVVRVNGRRFRVNIMSAITTRGVLWFTVFTSRFTAKVFTAFLDRLARQAGRKVHVVIADNHPVHRTAAVTAWLADNSDRIELHLMPSYSPNSTPKN